MLIHESHIAEHGEISNTSPIASSRPIGLVWSEEVPILAWTGGGNVSFS